MKGKKNPEAFGRKWRYLFMMLALVFSVGVSAQKTVIKGNISDRENLPVMWTVILQSPSAVPRLFYLLNISAIKMWKRSFLQ